jgi:predicted RNase H-like nuclease (RuvC/YqgF family)
MKEMYKTDPTQFKLDTNTPTSEDTKIQALERKINELTNRISDLETKLSRMDRAVRRQGTDVSNLAVSINRNRY